MVRDAARRCGDAEAVVDGDRRIDFATLRTHGRRRGARALLAVGHRARRPRCGVGAELARVDRRRARHHDRGRRARPDQHALQGRRGGVRARAQRRPGAVHRARVPRHRLSRRCSRAAGVELPALEHTILLAGEPTTAAIAWDDFVARGDAWCPTPISTRASRRSAPTTRATSCSRRARPAARRAS